MTEAEAIEELDARIALFLDTFGLTIEEVPATPDGEPSRFVAESKIIQVPAQCEKLDRTMVLLRHLGHYFGADSAASMNCYLAEFRDRFLSPEASRILDPYITRIPSSCE
jgi:hypothetical protein